MPSPQLPADKSLQRGIALIDQRPTPGSTELHSISQVQRLTIIEDITLPVV